MDENTNFDKQTTESPIDSAPEAHSGKKGKGALLGGLGILGILALKYKALLFGALKGMSLLKGVYLLKGASSLLLSLGLYTAFYGWKFAVTLILLIYIHEMGHYIYMKMEGLNPSAPVFVPFLGAYVAMKNLPDNKATHAWVGYAGPFVGGMAAAACYFIGLKTDNDFLVAAANLGFVLNLFQLIPVKPFDGGFVAECVSKWLLLPGTIVLIILTIMYQSFILLIVCGFSIYRVFKLFKEESKAPVQQKAYANNPYANVFPELSQNNADADASSASIKPAIREASMGERATISLAYIILAGSLACLLWHSGNYMASIHASLR